HRQGTGPGRRRSHVPRQLRPVARPTGHQVRRTGQPPQSRQPRQSAREAKLKSIPMNANAEARAAEFDNLQDEAQKGAQDVNLDVILDVPVTLSMEVGRTRIPIRNLLQLNQGSVVELDRAAGEPLDV